MEEQKTKVNGWKKIPIFFRVWIVLFTGAIIALITIKIVDSLPEKVDYSYSISYVSIEADENCIWVNYRIDAENERLFSAKDFSVMVNGIPVSAKSILTGTNTSIVVGGQITTNKITAQSYATKTGLVVCFDYTQDELDKPIQFFYKGQLLELGKSLHFEN